MSLLDDLHLKLEKVKTNEPELSYDENGNIILPENYWWCTECEAITPHDEYYADENQSPYLKKWACRICGYSKNFDYPTCLNCGFEIDTENTLQNGATVVAHTHDCSKTNPIDFACNCPREVIFYHLDVKNFKIWEGNTMECPGALDWSYEVRCEICGVWNEIEDGNC